MGFSAGFWRYVPTLFVSVGLFLTFLGLVSALESIVPAKGEVIGSDQLGTLLSVASAKFIMSLTGLLCSILFTLVLRIGIARAEAASHQVANEIESRLSFISLEYLAIEQLTKSAEATARSAADALAAAQAVLASKAKAVEATLDGVSVTRKLTGRQGRDIDGGEAKLDLEFLHEAVREKRVHRFWVLTTYTTLVNNQHSLARVPFAAAVFDEIQALKNPFSMRAEAARSVKANFRIGLTGTPIENSATDLWAIMDQIAPGGLDSMEAFKRCYGTPTSENMADLHRIVFKPRGSVRALAIRRVKSAVVSVRRLKERPDIGSDVIAAAIDGLATGIAAAIGRETVEFMSDLLPIDTP